MAHRVRTVLRQVIKGSCNECLRTTESTWLLNFISLKFYVLETIIALRYFLEIWVKREKWVDCGNVFLHILKLLTQSLSQYKLNKSESFHRETWRIYLGKVIWVDTLLCLKYICTKTLEAISFEVAVIALPGFLQRSQLSDFQDFFELFVVQAVISHIFYKPLVVLSHEITFIAQGKQHIRWNKLSLVTLT